MASRLGVIVAGGEGRRLGAGRPKALVELGGRTLLERAVSCLAAVCDDVVVAAPAGLDIGPCRARRVDDVCGAGGPLSGLVAGLESAPHTVAIALAVDFPLMRPEVIAALIDRLARSGAAAAVPRPGGVPQPLAAAYAFRVAPALRRLLEGGERSPVAALRALETEWLEDDDLGAVPGVAEAFLNVNTPGDLDRARALLAVEAEGV